MQLRETFGAKKTSVDILYQILPRDNLTQKYERKVECEHMTDSIIIVKLLNNGQMKKIILLQSLL